MFGVQIKDFMDGFLLRAPCDLNTRLFPDANIASRRPMFWPFLKGQGKDSETAYGINIPHIQLLLLEPADSRHEREVIIFSSLSIALGPPAADRTMGRWLRVCFGHAAVVLDGVFQTALYVSVIRRIVRDPIRLGYESITWRNDVHVFGPFALNGSKAFGIQRQLKDCRRLCFERELAVVNFIGPRPEFARSLHTPEHIGASKPAPIGEGRLNDDINTFFHRSFYLIVRLLFIDI